MIATGASLDDVAMDTGIGKPTLRMWLTALGDEYAEIRQTYIDNLLTTAIERIDASTDFLTLARAKEQWKYSTWIAERRDIRYSPVQQAVAVQINLVPPALQASATTLLDSMYSHVTPHKAAIEHHAAIDQVGQGGQGGGTVFPGEVVPPDEVGSITNTSSLSLTTTSSLCQEMTPSMNGSDTLE